MVNLDKNFLKLLFRFTYYMMAKTDRWYVPTGYLICFSTKFLVGISKVHSNLDITNLDIVNLAI